MKEDHLYRYEIHTARYQSYQLTNAKTYFIIFWLHSSKDIDNDLQNIFFVPMKAPLK